MGRRNRKRKAVTLLIGVMVLAALSGVLFAVRRMAARQEAKETEGRALVIEETADQIMAIRCTPSGGREVAFERREGLWVSTSDPEIKPDQTKVGILASSVTGVAVTQTIADAENLAQYGLETPRAVVVVATADGKVTELAIGDTNEATMDVYCYKNGDTSTVYAVSAGITGSLDHTIDDYLEESAASDAESAAFSAEEQAAE